MTTAAVVLACFAAVAVDGDTLTCILPDDHTQRVRIHALHAPEADQTRGPAATAELKHLLAGRSLRCVVVDVDRYGRAVADCATSQGDLAEAMILAGVARHCAAYGRPELAALPTNRLRLPKYCRP